MQCSHDAIFLLAVALISFVENEYRVCEDDSVLTLCLEITGLTEATTSPISITVFTSDSTTTGENGFCLHYSIPGQLFLCSRDAKLPEER